MRQLLPALFVALVVAGCATPYVPKDGSRYGYSETQLSPDMVEVFFDGNAGTPAEHASDFVLLRCSELALASGYSHFVVLERTTGVDLSFTTAPTQAFTTGTRTGSVFTAQTTTVGGGTLTSAAPHAIARIRMTRAAEADALDARFLVQSIKSKYGMP